jgi:signal transduction histidine kinase
VAELVLVGAAVLALALLAGALLAAHVARPLRRLETATRAVAAGDLAARAREEGSAEQRSVARSFNDMTRRLAALLRSQQQFVADASHQLRTPLTALRLRLEEARDAPTRAAAGVELEAATVEVDRLAETVAELLILSRAGERDRAVADVDLAAVAEAAAERFRAMAAAHDVAVEVTAAHGPLRVVCAREDLDRALDALVENALHYGPRGGVVEIAAGPGRIEVRDRGRGPAPGEEEAVFERFRRGRAGRATPGGTGLGLPIARELARGWGGDATLAARPGGGAVATLTIPAVGRRPASREREREEVTT